MQIRPATVPGVLSALALGVVLSACGPAQSTGPSDAGAQPDPAQWGLADKACFHYSDGTANIHAMAVEIDNGLTFGGITTYQLHYLTNGLQQGTDWVAPTGSALLLYQHYTPPSTNGTTTTPDVTTVFTPPPVYLQTGLAPMVGAKVTNTTAAATSDGATTMMPLQYTVNIDEVDSLMADGMAVMAPMYLVTVFNTMTMNATTSKVWFVPQLGIVQLGQPNSAPSWLLKSVDQNVATTNCY